ncbi:MAG: fibronectin type III domain-containing protein [Bacteroidota bacterium]
MKKTLLNGLAAICFLSVLSPAKTFATTLSARKTYACMPDSSICPGPMPASVTITALGTDFIAVTWTPVQGVFKYHAQILDKDSNFFAGSVITVGNTARFENLNGDTNYQIRVSSSYCD